MNKPMTATEIIDYARKHGIEPGPVLEEFRNGEVLREYIIPGWGAAKIRAFPAAHA